MTNTCQAAIPDEIRKDFPRSTARGLTSSAAAHGIEVSKSAIRHHDISQNGKGRFIKTSLLVGMLLCGAFVLRVSKPRKWTRSIVRHRASRGEALDRLTQEVGCDCRAQDSRTAQELYR